MKSKHTLAFWDFKTAERAIKNPRSLVRRPETSCSIYFSGYYWSVSALELQPSLRLTRKFSLLECWQSTSFAVRIQFTSLISRLEPMIVSKYIHSPHVRQLLPFDEDSTIVLATKTLDCSIYLCLLPNALAPRASVKQKRDANVKL